MNPVLGSLLLLCLHPWDLYWFILFSFLSLIFIYMIEESFRWKKISYDEWNLHPVNRLQFFWRLIVGLCVYFLHSTDIICFNDMDLVYLWRSLCRSCENVHSIQHQKAAENDWYLKAEFSVLSKEPQIVLPYPALFDYALALLNRHLPLLVGFTVGIRKQYFDLKQILIELSTNCYKFS